MTTADDLAELHQLAYRYAAAVDRQDPEAFADVFHPDGRLRVYSPDAEEPFGDTQGREQLAGIPRTMATMYRKTAHQMTNHLVNVDGDRATGELLCSARHVGRNPDEDSALVIIIRYEDEYERRDGRWRILDRHIRFQWAERHPLTEASFA